MKFSRQMRDLMADIAECESTNVQVLPPDLPANRRTMASCLMRKFIRVVPIQDAYEGEILVLKLTDKGRRAVGGGKAS